MAHRTRRRTVLRERRERAQEREDVRLENIAIDRSLRCIRLEHMLLLRPVKTAAVGIAGHPDIPTVRTAEEYERLTGRKWMF